MAREKKIAVRRTLEQAKHCIEEAMSVERCGEDIDLAIQDLEQAQQLITLSIKKLKEAHRA